MMWKPFDPSAYGVGKPLYVASGGWTRDVTKYTVTRITKGGQIVAVTQHGAEIRVNSRGNIIGEGQWGRRSVVDAATAAELRAEQVERKAWQEIRTVADAIDKAARDKDLDALSTAVGELHAAVRAVNRGQTP